jgi:hypothetical protein
MTGIARATADDLVRILEVFRDAAWPLPRAALATVADGLDWQQRSNREKGVTYLTGLPYRNARADCLLRDDEVLQVTIGLTERVDGDDPATRAPLRAVEQDLVAVATEVLGTPSGSSSGRTFWELGSGGRLVVENIKDRVLGLVLSPHVAEIERAESRLGVDPDRVVGQDPEPA